MEFKQFDTLPVAKRPRDVTQRGTWLTKELGERVRNALQADGREAAHFCGRFVEPQVEPVGY